MRVYPSLNLLEEKNPMSNCVRRVPDDSTANDDGGRGGGVWIYIFIVQIIDLVPF